MYHKIDVLSTCPRGHRYKSSKTCRTCPVCEKHRIAKNEFFVGIAAPARRALETIGITSVHMLAKFKENEIMSLHGMGLESLAKLKEALKEAGLEFKS